MRPILHTFTKKRERSTKVIKDKYKDCSRSENSASESEEEIEHEETGHHLLLKLIML